MAVEKLSQARLDKQNAQNAAHHQKYQGDMDAARNEATNHRDAVEAESYARQGSHGWEPLPGSDGAA